MNRFNGEIPHTPSVYVCVKTVHRIEPLTSSFKGTEVIFLVASIPVLLDYTMHQVGINAICIYLCANASRIQP